MIIVQLRFKSMPKKADMHGRLNGNLLYNPHRICFMGLKVSLISKSQQKAMSLVNQMLGEGAGDIIT